MRALPLLCGAILLAACGDAGSYELRWTIGCDTAGLSGCELVSIKDCSSHGLDSIRAVASSTDGDAVVSLFPCFAPEEGPVGRGPGLSPGQALLEVAGLSPGGVVLTPVVSRTVSIPDSGFVPVQVDLKTPPQCGDGVDNDLDGLVDLLDPDCDGIEDEDESS